jgi:nickel/cobalt transporter (NiCoT) family protein
MNDNLSGNFRNRLTGIYSFLVAVNIGAWVWALIAFHDKPILLGTAVLAYTFGLRHAVDADHIAAIDNVTRKLMQDGKRPVSVGFYFALGHSTVVIVAALVAYWSASTAGYSARASPRFS